MRTIPTTKIKCLALLGLGLGLAMPANSWAQPDPNNAPKAQNPPNRARRAKGQKGQKGQARVEARELATVEAVAGKPLTDEQKQKVREALTAREEAVRTAREKYIADVAASLELEPDAVRQKMRQANAQRNADGAGNGVGRRGGRRNRGAAAAPAAGG